MTKKLTFFLVAGAFFMGIFLTLGAHHIWSQSRFVTCTASLAQVEGGIAWCYGLLMTGLF